MTSLTTINNINNATFPTQVSLQHTQHLVYQDILQDANNVPLIKDMLEELSTWIVQLIIHFILALLIYTSLEYQLPLLLLHSPLVLSDCFLVWHYMRKYKSSE